MAKIKVRPRPGALSEFLKQKGMTQMDAFEKTRVDRKTLSKIDRGDEVKLETLQQVANKLQLTEEHFRIPVLAATTDGEVPELEPGTIMLRKLDWARLEELLKGAKTVRWHLKAHVRDDATRNFLGEFEQAVDDYRGTLALNTPEVWDGDPTLRFQLTLLKRADEVATRLEQLGEHGLALLGGDYLFWDHDTEECYHYEDLYFTENYHSSRTALLSVEPGGTQSRRVKVSQGSLPPRFAPDIRASRTTVFVNGEQLPTLDDSIPF